MLDKKLIFLLAMAATIVLAGCSGNGGASEEKPAVAWQEIEPGLSYVDSVLGDGPEVQADDFIVAHYAGYLWVDGAKTDSTKFDASYDRGEPLAFRLGAGRVIPGWERGVPGMHVGGKRSLLIEPDLAYGPAGRPPVIPPNSTLFFDVEIIDVPRVQVEIVAEGTGAAAAAGDNISVDYTGRLWVDGQPGEQFDSSEGREPFRFTLGAGQVIPGWDQGLEGMKVGTKARLIIPSVMGYGTRGSPPKIPADSDLVFDVELVEIKGK